MLPLWFNATARAGSGMMKRAIARIGAVFHSHRMMRRYAAEAYLSCGG